MTDTLCQDLDALMRNARAAAEQRQDYADLCEIATVMHNFGVARQDMAALADAARKRRQPLAPTHGHGFNGATPPSPSRANLMPHESHEEMDGGGNPALREALLRRGD